jgi:Xaa-Pro dipeptidase
MFTTRLAGLYTYMAEKGLAAVAVNAGPSLTYLTGLHFHLMERPVVIVFTPDHLPTIILPELEQVKLDDLRFPVQAFAYGENPDDWGRVFHQAMQGLALNGKHIGVEPRQLRLLEYQYLREACIDGDFIDGTAIFATLRSIKDENEIAHMRKAVGIAQDALEATLPTLKVGVSEKEIASELFVQLMRHGCDASLPFAPIVASGPNGANPHAQPSARLLTPGDLLIVDWGASYAGYVSDLTRTFAVGEIGKEEGNIHRLVQQANAAGRAAGRPGIACAAVDMATRKTIEDGGYGRYFTHRTGHGLGMECHEDPYIRGDNWQLLEAGMTYTVEPGIYLTGRNGVRIEDDVLVTGKGSESLSTMSREIRTIC